MSMNITLEGKRILTTQSGRRIVDRKSVERIRQTPTKVTYEILEKPTFEEKLEAYCKWEDEYCHDDGYWFTVEEYEKDMIDFYKNYNNSDYICEYGEEEPYEELRTNYVAEIQYPGDAKFEELNDNEHFSIIAAVHLKNRPSKEILELIIRDMREDEYEMEWGMI